MNNNTTLRSTAIAAALTLCSAFSHAAMSGDIYDRAKSELTATFKAERVMCDPKSGNAKDVCVETAKGREKVAMAHLEVQRTGDRSDIAKFHEARYEARYDLAKERCDDSKGQQKDLCLTAATTERDKAKASAKARKDMAESRSDEERARADADFKLAREKCNSIDGNGKDVCVATAKARFNQ